MTFLGTLRNLNNDTGLRVKSATSGDPLGPYNNDLVQLAMLTFSPRLLSVIEANLEKLLKRYLPSEIAAAQTQSTHSTKGWLILLKCLTVILYLLQHGAPEFVLWLHTRTQLVIAPIYRQSMHLHTTTYKDAIKHKIDSIYKYCTDDQELQKLRANMHVFRLDLATPGVKRANSQSAQIAPIKAQMPKRSRTLPMPGR